MVQRREKLSDVESDNARLETLSPPRSYQVGKVQPSILSGTPHDAPKLVGVKRTMRHTVEL